MPTTLLTDKTLRSLKIKNSKRTYVWDSKLKGFGVRLEPSGKKSFVLKYRFKGHQRMVTLAQYPGLSLAEARSRAHAILGRAHEGIDPNQTDLLPSKVGTFADILDTYIEKHCATATRENTRKEVERTLRKEFLPGWRHRDITEIRKPDVITVIDAILDRGHPSTANHAFANINHLFNWEVSRGVIALSPCHGLLTPAPKKSRERVLSDTELATVWQAVKETPYPFGTIVQLLILTGQRRGEVTGMRWDHVDLTDAVWTLPPECTKNKREHLVPLSPDAIAIFERTPRVSETLVFSARSSKTKTFSGFSKSKRRLDEQCGLTPWTLHDLRRTVATGLARLDVNPHVIERALNHVSGSFAGVAGTYNRYSYFNETRDALNLWAEHVESLEGTPTVDGMVRRTIVE